MFDKAVINYDSSFADCLKVHLVVVQLEHHKVVVVVKARGAEAASPINVATPDFPASARDEILDALLAKRDLDGWKVLDSTPSVK